MNHYLLSPSDLQLLYLLYMAYIQSDHHFHHEQREAALCKKTNKKKSTG